jgi:16S rRNA (cytidine1402-2'-O)-methyltransferase
MKELIVIALPIGNPADLSERAKTKLLKVDGILAEDTRKFNDFCKWAQLHLKADVKSFHAADEREVDLKKLLDSLEGSWALVSDAGTPAINDPGSNLVKVARQQKIKVSALPGPSALTLALQLTGGFGNPITFLGFPPKKVKKDFFEKHLASKTLLFFESRHNVEATLETLASSSLKNHRMVCLREMTKEHEEYFEGTIGEQLDFIKKKIAADKVGELTYVMESPGTVETVSKVMPEDLLELRKASPTQAAKIFSKLTGITRDEAYDLLSK